MAGAGPERHTAGVTGSVRRARRVPSDRMQPAAAGPDRAIRHTPANRGAASATAHAAVTPAGAAARHDGTSPAEASASSSSRSSRSRASSSPPSSSRRTTTNSIIQAVARVASRAAGAAKRELTYSDTKRAASRRSAPGKRHWRRPNCSAANATSNSC